MGRRDLLAAIGSVAASAAVAGCSLLDRDADAATESLPEDEARDLAESYAPTIYFDEHECWFPTDPRSYSRERDGETVVDGFEAFDGYTEAAKQSGGHPDPTLFYHAVRYEDSPLAVVQYWYYSVFDQFTTNFHWHDWEVLHVFVDTSTGEPQLYVASSHSGRVPNNEFLDPEPDRTPRILSELGSHSSALSVNDAADRFERLSTDGGLADITNSAIEGVEDLADVPVAYGLPRDEGSRLPYVVPELDGAPVYEHDRLPSVDRTDLVADDLTVRSFDDLSSPPGNLPGRSTGLLFRYAGRDGDADVEYDLVPSTEVEHLADFAGPQLGFEFAVPDVVEDAVAHHITTTGVPWNQPRYDNPAADISDPNHRAALAARYDAVGDPAPINTIVAGVTEAVASDDAPEDEGLTTTAIGVETVALLESEPEAIPTSGGVVVLRDVPEGDHRLTVNGPGLEPHSEAVAVADDHPGVTAAGVAGTVPLVARENATKLEVDPEGSDAELTDLAVEDDFAGRLYDAPLSGPDAVYVHRGGAFTVEITDADGDFGAFRVNPADESRIRVDEPRTGTASLAEYVAAVTEETAAAVAALDDSAGQGDGSSDNAVGGLVRALEGVAEAARRAAVRADAGERDRADQSLETVRERLDGVATRLDDARENLPDDLERATERRLDQSRTRTEQARAAEKL